MTVGIIRLWRYLAGYVVLAVRCPAPEKFINLLRSRGLRVWEARVAGRTLQVSMPAADFPFVRDIARVTSARVRVRLRVGWPFVWKRLRRRQFLVAGPLLVAAALYAFSSFIWFVEVSGAEIVEERIILAAAADLGLSSGAWKGRLSPERLARELPLQVEGLSWATIRIRGTVAVIEVAERVRRIEPEEYAARAGTELVAARDGQIETFIIIAGLPAVGEKATVRAGDVLVRPWPPAPGKPPEARAVVRARCWRQAEAEVARVETYYHRTGRAYHRLAVRVGGRTCIIRGGRAPAFELYEAVEAVRGRLWRNQQPTVEILQVVFWELAATRVERPRNEALALAREIARHEALSRVAPGIKVLREHFEIVTDDEAAIRVRVVVETLEDIARPGAHEPRDGGG
jgi:similar to stage IV sporulation protein